jgi:hypothetical protein
VTVFGGYTETNGLFEIIETNGDTVVSPLKICLPTFSIVGPSAVSVDDSTGEVSISKDDLLDQ